MKVKIAFIQLIPGETIGERYETGQEQGRQPVRKQKQWEPILRCFQRCGAAVIIFRRKALGSGSWL